MLTENHMIDHIFHASYFHNTYIQDINVVEEKKEFEAQYLSKPSIGKISRVTQRKKEQPLPKPFPLPKNFPPIVALALENKKLVGKSRTKFVTSLANAIFMHKCYPTSQEIADVLRTAVQKWEWLGTTSSCVSLIKYKCLCT